MGARFSQGRRAPFQGACRNHSIPVVFAALRPPATLSQTFGLHGRSFITLTPVSQLCDYPFNSFYLDRNTHRPKSLPHDTLFSSSYLRAPHPKAVAPLPDRVA